MQYLHDVVNQLTADCLEATPLATPDQVYAYLITNCPDRFKFFQGTLIIEEYKIQAQNVKRTRQNL